MVYSSRPVCARLGPRVCGNVAHPDGDTAFEGVPTGVSRLMCSCMVADMVPGAERAGGGL